MRSAIVRTNRFLQAPLGLAPRILLVAAALLLVLTYVL